MSHTKAWNLAIHTLTFWLQITLSFPGMEESLLPWKVIHQTASQISWKNFVGAWTCTWPSETFPLLCTTVVGGFSRERSIWEKGYCFMHTKKWTKWKLKRRAEKLLKMFLKNIYNKTQVLHCLLEWERIWWTAGLSCLEMNSQSCVVWGCLLCWSKTQWLDCQECLYLSRPSAPNYEVISFNKRMVTTMCLRIFWMIHFLDFTPGLETRMQKISLFLVIWHVLTLSSLWCSHLSTCQVTESHNW